MTENGYPEIAEYHVDTKHPQSYHGTNNDHMNKKTIFQTPCFGSMLKYRLHVKIKYQSTLNSQQCQGFTKEGQTPSTKSNFEAGKGTTM